MVSLSVFSLIVKFIILCRFPLTSSIADITRVRYDSTVLDVFRTLERTSVKLIKIREDLVFLSQCRDADLFPKFLRFKLPNSKLSRSSDIIRFRRRLLAKEITNKERSLIRLEERVAELHRQLKSMVKYIDYIHYQQVVETTCKKELESFKKVHTNKLLGLRSEAKTTNALLDPDSVITNLSSYQLSDIEKMALARGLSYTLPPAKLKKGSYLANFELLFDRLKSQTFLGSNDDKLYFKNQLRDCAFTSLYNFNHVRKSLSGLPPEEMRALKSLSKNDSIVVMKPDKGTGVIILDLTDYINKVEQIVSDHTKFKVHKSQDLYETSNIYNTGVELKKIGHHNINNSKTVLLKSVIS